MGRVLFISATISEAKGVLKHSLLKRTGPWVENSSFCHCTLSAPLKAECVWVATGMGPDSAESALEAALTSLGPFEKVVGVGVAGGLHPESKTGDLLIPSKIHFQEEVFEPSPILWKAFSSSAPKRFFTSGVTVNQVVRGPKEKESLFDRYGADFVDMESGAWALVCQKRGIDWCVIRSVLDSSQETLPDVFDGLSDAFGRSKGLRTVFLLLKRWRHLRVLSKVVRTEMNLCSRTLSQTLDAWIRTKPDIR